MSKIKTIACKHPIILSAVVFFFASFLCVITKEPSIAFLEQYMDLRKATWLYFTVYQALGAVAMIPLIKGAGIYKTAGFSRVRDWKKLWLCWPSVVLAILAGWETLSGKMAFNTSEPIVFILYFLLNLAVGFYEEMIGRSFVLNLMLQKWGNTKSGIYRAVFVSSIIFGVIHLTTVVMGKRDLIPGIGQVFYTFIFGVFFAACFIRYQSIWPTIFLHAFFDLCGSSGGLTARFGEVQQATVGHTIINVLYFTPILVCGLVLLRKVKPPVNACKP